MDILEEIDEVLGFGKKKKEFPEWDSIKFAIDLKDIIANNGEDVAHREDMFWGDDDRQRDFKKILNYIDKSNDSIIIDYLKDGFDEAASTTKSLNRPYFSGLNHGIMNVLGRAINKLKEKLTDKLYWDKYFFDVKETGMATGDIPAGDFALGIIDRFITGEMQQAAKGLLNKEN